MNIEVKNVRINNGCIGCGMCENICPTIFEMNSQGLAQLKKEPGVDEQNELLEAEQNCPVGVIETY